MDSQSIVAHMNKTYWRMVNRNFDRKQVDPKYEKTFPITDFIDSKGKVNEKIFMDKYDSAIAEQAKDAREIQLNCLQALNRSLENMGETALSKLFGKENVEGWKKVVEAEKANIKPLQSI